jgi:hypothetical protein
MNKRTFLNVAGAAALAAFAMTQPAAAEDVILTIQGDVADGAHDFTDADLMALPQITVETSTIWTEGVLTFSGPSLASLLDEIGAGDGDITLVAINDYVVEMPRDVIEAEAPIIAARIDGEPFSVRNKGPLWVIFPYDSDERFRAESVYAYSVWQLSGITVN